MDTIKTFIIDIDNTISTPNLNIQINTKDGIKVTDYSLSTPIKPVIDKIRKLYDLGHTIILNTSRGMKTFNADVVAIDKYHRPILEDWLIEYEVPYHALFFGKPWGKNVHYIDDSNLTINQFVDNEEDYQNHLESNTTTTKQPFKSEF